MLNFRSCFGFKGGLGGMKFPLKNSLVNANKLKEIVVLNMFAEEIIRGKFNF